MTKNMKIQRCSRYVIPYVFFLVSTCLVISSAQVMASSCDDYTALPPFLVSKLPPNVMFMLDNSGSMKEPLGSTTGYKCNSTDSGFNPAKTYFGMFASAKKYKYDLTIPVDPTPFAGTPYTVTVDTTSTGAFVEDAACTFGAGNNCWSGNFLNWMVTRKMDAARQVMIGGKVEGRTGYDYVAGDSGDLEWKIVGNNERSDYSICKAYSSSQSYSPFPANSLFTVWSPAEDGATKTSYKPYAQLSNSNAGVIVNSAGTVIGESGTVSNFGEDADAGTWKTVSLAKTNYSNPVVIARPLSYNGADPSVLRVFDVQAGSFKIRLEEWEYLDGAHTTEDFSYIVVEAGTHTLPGGKRLVAGKLNTNSTGANVASLGFAAKPVILTTVTTNNESDTVTTRLSNIGANGSFTVKLQEEESRGAHANETIAYLALTPGTYDVGLLKLEVGTITGVTNAWKTISYATPKSSVAFVADMQTTNDNDTASLRYRNLSSTSVEIFAEEEKSNGTEVTHAVEDVGYVIIDTPGYNIAVIVEEEPTGLVQDFAGDVRLGLSFYRYQKDSDIYNGESANGGTMSMDIPLNPFIKDPAAFRTIDTPIKSTLANMVDAIEHYPLVWGTTPLAENYYEVVRYFQQKPPYYENYPTIGTTYDYKVYDSSDNNPSNLWDPYYFTEYSKRIRCAKSFILLFTDGEPYKDDYVPYFYDSSGSGGTPNTVDYDADGKNNDCSNTVDSNANSCGDNLDDLAKWAYWDKDTSATRPTADFRDLRSDTGMDGNQYIQTYTVAFGTSTIPQILQDTAKNGNGVAYAAEDGDQLKEALSKAFTSILKQTSAGSSVSVMSERATEGSVIHQALFFPEKTFLDGSNKYVVEWTGSLNAYWFYNNKKIYNIREDNYVSGEYILDLFGDNALDFRVDAEGSLNIDYYSILNDGSAAEGSKNALLGTYFDTDDIHRIWEGGTILKDRDVEDAPSVLGNHGLRTIYGINKSGTMSEFTSDNYADFNTLFGLGYADVPSCLGTLANAASPTAAELQDRAENLISYTRGASDTFAGNHGGTCRNRVVDDDGSIWKLGDIIYSTPRLVAYSSHSVLFTGANDGMLHAFDIGSVRKDGLSTGQIAKLCDKKTGICTQNEIGKELWSFIPKNAMPYLKYLADPDYKHIYTIDLSPYHISHKGSDGVTRDIIIGGMRLGGSAGCTNKTGNKFDWCGNIADGLQVVPPECSPANAANCVGLSSYFALDVTDPDNPIFLWEFTNKDLGLTYSGPAYIRRGGNGYVMFVNGPLNHKGETRGSLNGLAGGQNLKVFILKVDSEFKLVDVDKDGVRGDYDDIFKFDGDGNDGYVKDSELANYNSAFGGRLFTDGLDWDRDGNTDFVFFGVNDASGASGNVTALVTKTDGTNFDPTNKASGGTEKANWYFDNILQTQVSPVTSKILHGECFGKFYIYFGTGRWFFKDDSPGVNDNDTEELYGVEITDCLIKKTGSCSINNAKSSSAICGEMDKDDTSWYIEDLLPKDANYYKERTFTDPTFSSSSNTVSFTTTQPSSNPCEFGGRSRVWAVNCATGQSIWDADTCSGYNVTPPNSAYLLQLSGGNIEDIGVNQDNFQYAGGKASDWFTGIPPESPTPLPEGTGLTGEIILWIER